MFEALFVKHIRKHIAITLPSAAPSGVLIAGATPVIVGKSVVFVLSVQGETVSLNHDNFSEMSVRLNKPPSVPAD